jgi:hypothetical protein
MAKYRKKPVVVEAVQWLKHGDNDSVSRYTEIVLDCDNEVCPICGHVYSEHGLIGTLEGAHIVCPGDWIITGVQGEKYPCKPDIFVKTYELV